MALSVEDLAEIEKVLLDPEPAGNFVLELRRRFPKLSLTQCDASDVTEEPFRIYPKFDLHLLDSADHCAVVTTDPARATGVILAKRAVRR